MSLCFLHARESSFLVTSYEFSHLLELAQLQAGGQLWVLSPGLCPAPAHPPGAGRGGDTLQPPLCRFLLRPRNSKTPANPPRARAAMGWVWAAEKSLGDFLGMGLDLGGEKSP